MKREWKAGPYWASTSYEARIRRRSSASDLTPWGTRGAGRCVPSKTSGRLRTVPSGQLHEQAVEAGVQVLRSKGLDALLQGLLEDSEWLSSASRKMACSR